MHEVGGARAGVWPNVWSTPRGRLQGSASRRARHVHRSVYITHSPASRMRRGRDCGRAARRAVLLRAVGPRVRDINVVVRVDLLLLVRRDVVLAADIELDRAALVVQRRDIEAVPKDGAWRFGAGGKITSEARAGMCGRSRVVRVPSAR